MKDVQSQPDYRNIPIDKVGIKNLRYPITVRDRRDGFQHTIALIDMFVDLPHNNKGTHMSRFVELLHLLRPEVSLQKFSVILENMKQHLKAASAHLEMTFPYFIKFVEDIVRDVAEKLNADDNITWFSVSAENFESIHNHSAYASITSG